jgi:hypothetical protein
VQPFRAANATPAIPISVEKSRLCVALSRKLLAGLAALAIPGGIFHMLAGVFVLHTGAIATDIDATPYPREKPLLVCREVP